MQEELEKIYSQNRVCIRKQMEKRKMKSNPEPTSNGRYVVVKSRYMVWNDQKTMQKHKAGGWIKDMKSKK